MIRVRHFYFILFVFALSAVSCTRYRMQTVYPTLSDGRYDSEFPYRNCSKQLDKIAESIRRINCLVLYRTYYFELNDNITDFQISSELLATYKSSSFVSDESTSGTASVIYSDINRLAFLTCAHVVNFKDTITSYYKVDGKSTIIQSIAIREKQSFYISGLPDGGDLEIIALDSKMDIAILGKTLLNNSKIIPVFPYPCGESKSLEWGSFVYIMGFPLGYQMITKGIVSSPDKTKNGYFLIDAVFNKGFSGGLVFAIKDGVPNFELVGMARAASSTQENILKPEKESFEKFYNPNNPYSDNIYVQLKRNINYGITYAISIETLRDFYLQNEDKFLDLDYNLSAFFKI